MPSWSCTAQVDGEVSVPYLRMFLASGGTLLWKLLSVVLLLLWSGWGRLEQAAETWVEHRSHPGGLTAELSSLRHLLKPRHLHTLYFPNNLPSPGFPHVPGAAQTRDLPVLPLGCLTIGSESIRLPQLWSSSRRRATRRSGISLISSNNGLLVHSWFSYDFNGTAFPP